VAKAALTPRSLLLSLSQPKQENDWEGEKDSQSSQ
jgi:hypothetical protein